LEIPLRDQILRRITRPADGFRDRLNGLTLGFRHAQPRLRLPVGGEHRRLLRAFRVDDLRLLLAFRAQNRRRLVALRRRHHRAPRPLRRHLLFHRQTDFFRRRDVLELDAHHLHAPLLRRAVERFAQLRVGGVARRQRVIEIELADHVAQRRERELLEAPGKVLHLVGRAHGVRDQVIDDCVHLHRHVIARDDRLRFDFCNLLAQVNRGPHRIEEGEHGVEAGFGRAVVLAEPLDDLHLLLRNDLDRPHQDDQQEEREAEEDNTAAHTRTTSSTMPSAPTTRTVVPAAIISLLRAAQSSPPTLTRPRPSVRSTSCVTTPCLPMSGSVRGGTPRPPIRLIRRERSPASDTTSTTMNVVNCTGTLKPKNAATAAATAPAPTKAKPKCGTDTSTTPATNATASQASIPT